MSDELKKNSDLFVRTKTFAVRIVKMYAQLPKTTIAQTLGKQVLRSGTSVGAQYRECRRARSDAEFVSKMEAALQELDETSYWLDLFVECNVVPAKRLSLLQQEAEELIAILVASVRTVKNRKNKP